MNSLSYAEAREKLNKEICALLLLLLAFIDLVGVKAAFLYGFGPVDNNLNSHVLRGLGELVLLALFGAILYVLYRFWFRKLVRRRLVEGHLRKKFLEIYEFSPENAYMNPGTKRKALTHVGSMLHGMARDTRVAFAELKREEEAEPTSLTEAGIRAQKEKIEDKRRQAKAMQAETWLAYDVAAFLGFVLGECLENDKRSLERLLELTGPFAKKS